MKASHSFGLSQCYPRLLAIVFALLFILCAGPAAAQFPVPTPNPDSSLRAQHKWDSIRTKAIDSTLSNSPTVLGHFHRPQASFDGLRTEWTTEDIRYYGLPVTFPNLLEESGVAYPLIQTDEAYGRESFLMTSRASEGITSTLMNGALPMNDPLTGNTMLGYFPLDEFSKAVLDRGSSGNAITGSDYASSDAIDFTLERFRAPVPYSRVRFTQALSRSFSVFDGLFSLNASPHSNLAFGIYRRGAGHAPTAFDPTFNPRTDDWSIRSQWSYSKPADIVNDTLWTKAQRDSASETAKAHSLDALVWGQYTTAFSGLNGGISALDSVDIFDSRIAPVVDPLTFDHRIRIDGLAQIEMPLFGASRTRWSAYGTYSSRRFLSPDSTFAQYVEPVQQATRFGAQLEQPFHFEIGHFITSAHIIGDIQRIDKQQAFVLGSTVSDSRLSASLEDSVAINGVFRISLFGFVRAVESNLKIGTAPIISSLFPNIGFAGTLGITNALDVTASYSYQKDRAALSPTPGEEYLLRNIGGALNFHAGLSSDDSISIRAGVLDRNEPEGIVYSFGTDTLHPMPRFSSAPVHSQSAELGLDAYISNFHLASTLSYFPAATPTSKYTQYPQLQSDLPQKFFGSAGVYYENELAEGNLRLSLGGRMRYLNRIDPQLNYDPAADYYLYRGLTARGIGAGTRPLQLDDPRTTNFRGIFDILLRTEIDRRAQINMSFLNILGTPYYNVGIYPREGFTWRIDVVWAFLD